MPRTSRSRQTTPAHNPTPTGTDDPAPRVSKLGILAALLHTPEGASLAALCKATGWQSHSVRGAMAGALRRKGHVVNSSKAGDGVRRYRIGAPA
jgi:hypothetical protein